MQSGKRVVCKVIVSHPFGNPNTYNAALAFQEQGLLDVFWTSLFLPLGMGRRYHPGLRRELVHTRPLPEMIRLAATQLPLESGTEEVPIGRIMRGRVLIDTSLANS